MHRPDIRAIVQRYPIISDQVKTDELQVLLEALVESLNREPSGAVVEFGCYIGTTSLFIRRVMDALGATGEFHVYDSFEGLPAKSASDHSPAGEQFRPGELAVSKKTFVAQFKKAGLGLPRIHKSWFADLTATDVPECIGFAFLDGDYYESIRDSLRLITPKLLPGATIIVDDYASEALPGAARAVHEWRATCSLRHTMQVQQSLSVIRLV